MPEWLKNFLDKIKEWWLKFTTRQKAIIIGLSLVAVVVFIVIISVVSRPQYVTLITCETTQEASKVTGILTDSAIEYDISNNALVIKVRQEDLANAELALGASGYFRRRSAAPEHHGQSDRLQA